MIQKLRKTYYNSNVIKQKVFLNTTKKMANFQAFY